MPLTIDDFEDDGASFRVRRDRQLHAIYVDDSAARLLRPAVVIAQSSQEGRHVPARRFAERRRRSVRLVLSF